MEGTKIVAVVLAMLITAACGGKGTEVLNPVETLSIKGLHGDFTIGLMEGWDYVLCSEDQKTCDDVYQDPMGSSESLVVISKGETKTVFFADNLLEGESLTDYVNDRISPEDETESQTEDGLEMIIVNVTEDDYWNEYVQMYASDGEIVAWLWVKLAFSEGMTEEEMQALADEWVQMGQTITIE